MPTKKSTRARARTRSKKAPAAAAARLRQTWQATLSTLNAAQKEAERQLKLLVRKNRITTEEASAALKTLNVRLQREGKRAAREVHGRLATIQARLLKERRNVARMADDAVHGTLAALNIPSRKEVAELTRKVDDLSRKIDGFRRPGSAAKHGARRAVVVPAPAA